MACIRAGTSLAAQVSIAIHPSRNVVLRILIAAAALTAMNYAQAQDQKLTAQQERMKTCNAQAGDKNLKGDERQHFMSSCLKGEDPKELTAQQEKMKTCNHTASERKLKGDERRSFMSECLRADG